MEKRKRSVEKTIFLTTIILSAGIPAVCMTELLDAEIRLTVERLAFALDNASECAKLSIIPVSRWSSSGTAILRIAMCRPHYSQPRIVQRCMEFLYVHF
ncbi:hypothetical protein AYI68_g1892 [Smittium mucronatum]|uniref:Uncharacterized protein n=1 Tax=Smittium mucronatum TaxID=133383 RepID=A0A1R0H4B9_9FUNG|nr:hypothetical protein AYI68_g1892 [Smittium mucronatum]